MTISVQTRRQLTQQGSKLLSKIKSRGPVAKQKKPALKPTTVALYASVFVAVVAIVSAGYSSPRSDMVASVDTAQTDHTVIQPATSVNEVVATVVAANVAEVAHLPVAANVANLSVSLSAKSEVTSVSDTESVAKQQLIISDNDRRELVNHVVKSGETLDTIANEYGVSKETIKWANNLTGETLSKGKKLVIPPVDGVVYVVEKGDTVAKLADRYKASEERIVAFNNLELAGLKPKSKIIIPSGKLPEAERPGYVAPSLGPSIPSVASWMPVGSTAGNGYAYGYCTWYVKNARPDLPNQLGNANTWYARAAAMGLSVGSEPRAGAVFQTAAGGGGYGHVGMIDSVDHASGTVTYSDMNGVAGWNRVGKNTVSIAQAKAQWNFIY